MSFNNDDSRRGFGNDRKRHFGRTARPTFDEAKFNREHPDEEPERRSFGERPERRGGIGSQAHLRRDRDDFKNRPSRFASERRDFGERNFGERRDFSAERTTFDDRRASQDNVVPAVGDADAAHRSPSAASRKSRNS